MGRTERKHSKKRDIILEAIRTTQTHPGAQWIYDRIKPSIPSLSLGTVYRNIKLFQEEGSVISVCTVNGEERFDGRVSPHPHLICSCCGKVADLPCPADDGCSQTAEAAENLPGGFIVDYRKTIYYGLCSDCAAASQAAVPCKKDNREPAKVRKQDDRQVPELFRA
jgi:Fur family peroxide stress response transcriptional regulator